MPSRLSHPGFGRFASLQLLAIPPGIAVLCVSCPILNRGALARADLFGIAIVSLFGGALSNPQCNRVQTWW
jgi:hypothetical protein